MPAGGVRAVELGAIRLVPQLAVATLLCGEQNVRFVRPARQIHDRFVEVNVGADGQLSNTSRDW